MSDRINVTKSSMPPIEEYFEEIRSIWDTVQLTNSGEKHRALEMALCKYLGAENLTLFTNGHLALEAAIRAFELPQGAEVITTPFTFASTTNAIIRCGLVPVFCDVRESDFTIDPDLIESLITDKTAAVIPVHVYGNICDTDAIDSIAHRHGIPVIYDAAHTFGVKKKDGGSVAALGDASVYSFHATKVFNTIEGGAVCFGDSSLRRRLDGEKNFGITENGYVCYGGNAKMNEFQAAMGLCNLRHIDEELRRRRTVYETYKARLSGVDGIRIPLTEENVEMNFAYLPVIFDGYKYHRDRVAELLEGEGIFPRKYFAPLTSRLLGDREDCTTPVAKKGTESVLTLPMYADLSPDDVNKICDIILK